MGTDRDLFGEGRCPCGKGKIVFTRCSPDHPWGGNAWFENSIDCCDCAATYEFASGQSVLDNRRRLVRREDIEEREGHREILRAKLAAILAMPSAQRVLAQAESAIDQARTVAAKYRLLAAHGLAGGSEGTFRRRFRTSADFVQRLGADDLPRLVALVGKERGDIVAALAEAAHIRERANVPIPSVKTSIPGLLE